MIKKMTTPPIAEAEQAGGLVRELRTFAATHGLGPVDPRVLAVGSNLVVHLAPAPVVARAANVTVAGRDRPGEALAREVRLAQHLVDNGFHTVAPSSELPPGPHELGGWWVSFFTYVELTRVEDHHATLVGERLVDLVEVAGSLVVDDDPWPARTIREETETFLDLLVPRLSDEDGAVLRRAAEASWVDAGLVESESTRQALHGDAHRNNVGLDADGNLIWFDFDDTVNDFPEVDYSTLLRSWPEAGEAACRAAGLDHSSEVMRQYLTQRETYVALWIQLFGLERPDQHRERAAVDMARLRKQWG